MAGFLRRSIASIFRINKCENKKSFRLLLSFIIILNCFHFKWKFIQIVSLFFFCIFLKAFYILRFTPRQRWIHTQVGEWVSEWVSERITKWMIGRNVRMTWLSISVFNFMLWLQNQRHRQGDRHRATQTHIHTATANLWKEVLSLTLYSLNACS